MLSWVKLAGVESTQRKLATGFVLVTCTRAQRARTGVYGRHLTVHLATDFFGELLRLLYRMQTRSVRRLFSTSSSVQPASPALSSLHEDEHVVSKSWRRYGFSALLLFLPCAATFGLGTWQLFRRQWKMDMLDYRLARLNRDPLPLSAVSWSVSFPNGSRVPCLEQDIEYRHAGIQVILNCGILQPVSCGRLWQTANSQEYIFA